MWVNILTNVRKIVVTDKLNFRMSYHMAYSEEARATARVKKGKEQRDFHAKLRFAQNDGLKKNFEFWTDERSKRRGQIYLHYALQEGGNEDLLLVILNYELQNATSTTPSY